MNEIGRVSNKWNVQKKKSNQEGLTAMGMVGKHTSHFRKQELRRSEKPADLKTAHVICG